MTGARFAELPTPLYQIEARLVQTEQVGSASEVFNTALLVGEVLVKWSTATALSLLRAQDSARADRLALSLVRTASLGGWVPILRQASNSLHRAHYPGSRTWAGAITRKVRENGEPRDMIEAVDGFRRVIRLLGEADYTGFDRGRHSILDLITDLVFIRNRTRGHGAQTDSFFSEAAPLIASAIRSLMQALPKGAVWWWDTHSGEQQALLIGATPLIGGEPLASTVGEADEIGPVRVQVRTEELRCDLEGVVNVEDTDGLGFAFANGRWNDAKAICQFINYATGKTSFHQPGYTAVGDELLPSETSARETLVWLNHVAHNLPPRPAGYVNRPALEGRLRSLLTDKRHRVVTLRGGGGMGKTVLALYALWDFIDSDESFGYDFILWFSARDIDLLEAGPEERRRDVSDVDDVAESFAQLMSQSERTGPDARRYLTDQLSGAAGTPNYMIVLDNLETFENPTRIQQVLDESVILPSKVLLTSRHEEFKGDYPVDVAGMEEPEADRLMVEEARRHAAEPRVNKQVRDKIARFTGSRAYAMKLAVAQIGRGKSPVDVAQSIPARSDLLAALFDRSFEQLTEDGHFLYLMLGAVGRSVPELALKAIATVHDHNYESGATELVALSLVSRDEADAAHRHLSLPEMAYRHARGKLVGDPDEIQIRTLSKEFRKWITPRGTLADVEAFASSVIDAATSKPESTGLRASELFQLTEALAEDYPSLWPQVAAALDEANENPERVRRAYRRAAEEAEVNDAIPWQRWANFEHRAGNDLQALLNSIRAVEADPTSADYCSRVASELTNYISNHKGELPVARRSFLVTSVRGHSVTTIVKGISMRLRSAVSGGST